jgi:hypothetical protein
LHSLFHTNCCKQSQEDEEIQNDIDFSSIKPKLKSRRRTICSPPVPRDLLRFGPMATLTRRPDKHCADCWLIYFGDVHVGTIACAVGTPKATKQCGFVNRRSGVQSSQPAPMISMGWCRSDRTPTVAGVSTGVYDRAGAFHSRPLREIAG